MENNIEKNITERKYYYAENGVTFGPFSLNQLLEKIECETLVYREGIDWTNAKDIEELKKFFVNEELEISSKTYDLKPEFNSITTKDSTYNTIVVQKKMFSAPFSFDGRIRRTEFGISFIIYIFAYAIIISMIESAPIFGLAYIPIIWFLWAQGAKRCHDRGNSGWYQIIPFYVFWLLFAEGDSGNNEYGNSPK